MKYFQYISFLLAGAAALSLSCEQEDITTLDTKTAVVQAYLFAGQPVDSVRVTQSCAYARQDSTLVTLDDLDVYLDDGGQRHLLNPVGDGYYRSPMVIDEEKSYRLEFGWNGEKISAETFVPSHREASLSATVIEMEKIELGSFPGGGFPGGGIPGEGSSPLTVTWDNPEADNYYVVIRNVETDPEYINERLAQFENENGGRRRFAFIGRPQVMNSYSIDPNRQLTQFGLHQVIVYRVMPEYAALYDISGTTSVSIVQPPGNVDNGLGIFTGVSSDTLYFTVKKQ